MENVNVNVCTSNPIEIEDDEQNLEEEIDGSLEDSSDESNDSDEETEEINPHCKPQQLMEALNKVKNIPPDYVITFELKHSPLLVIEKTKNNDRITFPIYNRIIDDNSNSMQFKPDDFQITNPSWVEYLNNFVLPKVKFEMVLDFEIKPNLKSFWIIQSPSVITSLVQGELGENTFATLVIQLPSKFDGGEHQIVPTTKHACFHYSRFFNFPVKSKGKSEFSPFGIVFHRDYKHQMKPITTGVGAYLVYDLEVNINDFKYIPKTPTFEDETNEITLRQMLNHWKDPSKIVIGLSNSYAKEDLSLETLKSDDLRIAMQLKKQCDFLNDFGKYEMFLGYLTRTYHGEVVAADTRFNTKDASNILQTEYHIECLKHINGKEMVDFNYFHVNFSDEVWPLNCFEDVKPHRCSRERPHNINEWDEYEVGLHVAKYYRRPVIVLFKRYNFIQALKKSYVGVAEIYKIFIALYKEYERRPVEEYTFRDPGRFNNWGRTISCMSLPKNQQNTDHSKELTVSLLKVFISLAECTYDAGLLRKYFECNRVLTDEIVQLLISHCNKLDWLPFSQQLCDIFNEIKTFATAQKYLNYFIDDSGVTTTLSNKQNVLQSVLNTILNKQKGRHDHHFNKFFRSVWNLAKKGGLCLQEYGKSQKIENIVPVLIELAEQNAEMKCDNDWLSLANHFLQIMESHIANNLALSWRRPNIRISTRCDCIQNLVTFLNDDIQSTTFNLHLIHRKHLKSVINRLSYINCLTSEESGTASLFVIKTEKVGQQKMFMAERTLEMLEKLRTICQAC